MWQRWMIVHKVVLKTVLPVLRRLPHRVSVALLGAMGRVDLLVVPKQGAMYEAAVADAGRRLGCDWDAKVVSRKLARQTYRWRARDFLLDGHADRQVARWFKVIGREHLDAAVAQGKGVVLLANHFGSHLLTSHWLFRQGYPLRWFSEKPRNVSKFMARAFATDGPLGQTKMFISRRSTPADAASSIFRASKALNAGMIVKVACDVRWCGQHTARASFLGHQVTFSKTWVNLAAMTGAAVVPVFCHTEEDGTYQLEFLAPYNVPKDVPRTGQDAWWVQSALNVVEERVRHYPEQSNDYFFWDDDVDGHAA
ncbi:MAG TPA: lysophospholipid acyltransferase family protein [Isosphaeraceae bacterium]